MQNLKKRLIIFNNGKNKEGFTLVEMMVAITIFGLVIGAMTGVLISGIRAQRRLLAEQELLAQTSYLMEYMSRAIRMAKKELANPSVCLTQRGLNFETNPLHNKIRFINDDGYCQQFYLADRQIRQAKSLIAGGPMIYGNTFPLTSPNLNVEHFRVRLKGEYQTDLLQPRVTLFLHIEDAKETEIKIQTTISQRDLDIIIY